MRYLCSLRAFAKVNSRKEAKSFLTGSPVQISCRIALMLYKYLENKTAKLTLSVVGCNVTAVNPFTPPTVRFPEAGRWIVGSAAVIISNWKSCHATATGCQVEHLAALSFTLHHTDGGPGCPSYASILQFNGRLWCDIIEEPGKPGN